MFEGKGGEMFGYKETGEGHKLRSQSCVKLAGETHKGF